MDFEVDLIENQSRAARCYLKEYAMLLIIIFRSYLSCQLSLRCMLYNLLFLANLIPRELHVDCKAVTSSCLQLNAHMVFSFLHCASCLVINILCSFPSLASSSSTMLMNRRFRQIRGLRRYRCECRYHGWFF